MAVRANIVIDQGSDYRATVNVENINSIPADLDGYTASGQMRKYYTSSRFYEFNVEVDTEASTITLSMTANTTNNIPYGRYVYDCEITSPEGVRTRLIEGIVTVTPQVTR